jgi:hypothetical protein
LITIHREYVECPENGVTMPIEGSNKFERPNGRRRNVSTADYWTGWAILIS